MITSDDDHILLQASFTMVTMVCRYYLFFTNSFVYYGLTLNSGSLIPGNLHFNIIVRFILSKTIG